LLSELMKNFKVVDVTKMRAPEFLRRQDEIEKHKLHEIEKGGRGWREVTRCPVCASTERRPELVKHGIELVACQSCGTRYGAQMADLDAIYKDPNYVSFSADDTVEHFNYRRERFGRERVGILEKYCGNLEDKRILDVGCGNGYFLSVAAEKSKRCYGAEFSEKLRRFTEEKTGCKVYDKTLDQLPAEGFDIITLFDLIEHIPEPVRFMKDVDRILAPGGYILIFTPVFDSFGIRVMGPYSSIVDPTEHVLLFTMSSLAYLGRQFGYEIVYAETQGLDVANILAMRQYKGEAADRILVEYGNELQAIINAAGCGDYGRMMYRKPS
jgi:2-polyprenyl-3-methyl-5-hydroxy-6-metoxy-1,4-benzoquinol methylase